MSPYPMKTAPQNVRGVPHSDQSGVGPREKRCTKCGKIKPLTEYYNGRGYRNRRAKCKGCEAKKVERTDQIRERDRKRHEWFDSYVIIYDPLHLFLGMIRGYDFKTSLRCGCWPTGMFVMHKGMLYIVKGRRLHEADTVPPRPVPTWAVCRA